MRPCSLPPFPLRLRHPSSCSYIVLPHILLTSVSPVLYFIPLFGTVVSSWRIFINHSAGTHGDVWRLLIWILFFISGWALTAGSLQAYCLADGDRRLRLTPRRLNTLFLGVLVAVGTTMLVRGAIAPAPSSLCELTDTLVRRRSSSARAFRCRASRRSVGSPSTALPTSKRLCGMAQRTRWHSSGCDISGISTTGRRAISRRESPCPNRLPLGSELTFARYRSSYMRLLSVYMGALAFVLVTNIATFAIVVLIRRQIGESIDMLDLGGSGVHSLGQHDPHLPPALPPTPLSPLPPHLQTLSPAPRGGGSPSRSGSRTPTHTRSDIEKMAKPESGMVVEQEQARRIVALSMAEKGLKIVRRSLCCLSPAPRPLADPFFHARQSQSCLTISIFITLISIICLWTLITWHLLDKTNVSWGTIEASLLLPGWLCAVLFGASQSLRLWRGWGSLPPPRPSGSREDEERGRAEGEEVRVDLEARETMVRLSRFSGESGEVQGERDAIKVDGEPFEVEGRSSGETEESAHGVKRRPSVC